MILQAPLRRTRRTRIGQAAAWALQSTELLRTELRVLSHVRCWTSPSRSSWADCIRLHINLGNPAINLPFGDGFYHPCVVILKVVCYSYCMRMHCNLRGSDPMRATYFQRYQEHGTFQEFEGPWDRVAKFLNYCLWGFVGSGASAALGSPGKAGIGNNVRFFNRPTSKSARTLRGSAHFHFQICFGPQWRAFFHLSDRKIRQDGSAPAAFASLLFDPPEPQNFGKIPCRAPASSFFWLFLFSDLLFIPFSSLTLPTSAFPSVHIVRSLTSKLPSIN